MAHENIESKKSPFGNFYTGYSNLGVVRINGSHGFWQVYMGKSQENERQSIAGLYVGNWPNLSEVSEAIKNLELTVNNGQRIIRARQVA